MKRIIISTLALALMAGLAGSASADEWRHRRNGDGYVYVDGRYEYRNGRNAWKRGRWQRSHRHGYYGRVRYAYPVQAPPAIRYERYDYRHGYTWVPGHWDWNGYEWYWMAGHYEREQPGRQYIEGRWVMSGGRWEWRPGYWAAVSSTPGSDHPHTHTHDQEQYPSYQDYQYDQYQDQGQYQDPYYDGAY